MSFQEIKISQKQYCIPVEIGILPIQKKYSAQIDPY